MPRLGSKLVLLLLFSVAKLLFKDCTIDSAAFSASIIESAIVPFGPVLAHPQRKMLLMIDPETCEF